MRKRPSSDPGMGGLPDWAPRNDFWLDRAQQARKPYRAVAARKAKPLILCGYGVSLRVEADALIVRNGLTHHPQTREEWRFFRGDRALPSRIIVMDGKGSLSFDVLDWLASQEVGFARINFRGEVLSMLAGGTPFLNPDRVGWQVQTRHDHAERLAVCGRLISAKLAASIVTLRTEVPDSSVRARALAVAEATTERLYHAPPSQAVHLMLAEARAAGSYFTAWRGLPMRWRKGHHSRVPKSWLGVEARRSYGPRRAATNRNATHPINAMLNYGYAVLHSSVQAQAIAEGFDPALGLLHASGRDRSAFVLDVMEPTRPAVDAAILHFVGRSVFSVADFAIRSDGVCRLAPQLARRVAECASEATQASLARSTTLSVFGYDG